MGMHGCFLSELGIDKNSISNLSYNLNFGSLEESVKFREKVIELEEYLINSREIDPDDYQTSEECLNAIENAATAMTIKIYMMLGEAIQQEGSQIIHIIGKSYNTNDNILMDKSYYTNVSIADRIEAELRENRKMLKHQCGWTTGIEKNDTKGTNKFTDKIKMFFIKLKNKIGGN